jgi:hypothetical protein
MKEGGVFLKLPSHLTSSPTSFFSYFLLNLLPKLSKTGVFDFLLDLFVDC